MWITQLVVHHQHRGKGYASTLLRSLVTSQNPVVVGVASSHPHGLLALKWASMSTFDKDFIKENVARVYTLCNIQYLIGKSLVGSVFEPNLEYEEGQAVAQVNSEFYTDHTEPLEALANLPVDVQWPLGPLLEGHEFVVVFRVGSSRKKEDHSLANLGMH